jgi:hypothetical protein
VSQNRTIKAILALEIDKKALGDTEKAIDRFNAVLETTRKRTVGIEDAADDLKKAFAELARQDAINKVAQDLTKAEMEGKDFNEALRVANQRLVDLGASKDEIAGVARGFRTMSEAADAAALSASRAAGAAAEQAIAAPAQTLGAGLGPTFQKIGRFGVDLRALPSVQLGGGVSSDVIGKVLGSVGSGLSEVTVTASALAGPLAAVAVAFGALLVVFIEFSRQQEVAAKNIRAIIAGQQEYYDLLLNGTRAEVEAARDAAAEKLAIDRAALAENRRSIQSFSNQYQTDIAETTEFVFGKTLSDAIRFAAEKTNPAVQALVTEFERLQGEVSKSEIEVGRLNGLLQENATAANDAAESQLAYQNILIGAAVRRSQIEADTLKFLETATRESADARIQAAEDELDRLFALNERLAEIGGPAAEALIKENQARIDEQVVIRETTRALLEGSVGAREAAGKAIFGIFEDISGGLGDAVNTLQGLGIAANASEEVFALQAKIAEAATKTGAAIDAIIAKLSEAEAKALADRDQGLADAQEKYNDAREKQETAHRDRLLAINQRANTTMANAVGNRDALAFFLAQQQKKAELKEENTANKRRLSEIDKALRQQTEQVIRRYNEQVEVARKAANAAIAIENEKLRVLQTQLNAEITALNAANAQMLALQTSYWNASIATDVAGANSALSVISQFWNGVLGVVSTQHSSTPIIPTVVPYDGSSTPSTDYSSSDLTLLSSPRRTSTSGGTSGSSRTASDGVVVNINGLGMTDTQVSMKVQRELNRTLKAARQQQLRTAT